MTPTRLPAMSSSLLLLAAALAAPAAFAALAATAPAAAAGARTAAPPSAAAGPAAAAAPTGPAASAGPAAASGPARRVALPGPDGKPYPYTVEIPAGWQVLFSKDVPGVFLGPASGLEPEKDVRMIYVRVSPASVLDPEAVVANIKKSAAGATWSAPLVEVREVGGVRGVLVRMDSGSGADARSTLVLKMPLGQTSVDFMASAPRAAFEGLLPGYQRVILSVLPVR
jgi:hypothetical protein